MTEPVRVLHGDALEQLASLPDNSIDALVTDPPYGLSAIPDASEVLRHWIAGDDYQHRGGGFMGACLHPDSDILTDEGWRKSAEVSVGDRVASLDPLTNTLEYVPVIKTHAYHFSGDLLRIGGRSAAQLVTPNHNIWRGTSSGWSLQRADQLPAKFRLSNQARWLGKIPETIRLNGEEFEANNLLRFFGLWLGDGYVCHRKAQPEKQDFIGFGVYKSREIDAVRTTCTNLGLRFTETPHKQGVTFYVYNKSLLRWLAPMGGALEKRIPTWIFELSSSLLESLFQGLMDTDGWRQKHSGKNVFYTSNAGLADDVQRLALHVNRSACVSCRPPREGGVVDGGRRISTDKPCYVVSILSPGRGEFWLERNKRVRPDGKFQPAALESKAHDGPVVCVTLARHHIMMTRYDGKPVWTGNSWDSFVPGPAIWREALRVCKPGATGVVFASTRTLDLMTAALRIAGWEIVSTSHWCFASAMPKSLDVSKQMDRVGGQSAAEQAATLRAARETAGLTREQVADEIGCTPASIRDWEEGRARAAGQPVEFVVPSQDYREKLAALLGYSLDQRDVIDVAGAQQTFAKHLRERRETAGISRAQITEWFPQYAEVTKNWERTDSGFRRPVSECVDVLIERLGLDPAIANAVGVRAEDQREVVSQQKTDRRGDGTVLGLGHSGKVYGGPQTSLAQQWAGWGTSLKPAHEPMVLVRKPNGTPGRLPSVPFTFTAKAPTQERASVFIPACKCLGDPHDPQQTPEKVASTEPQECDNCGTPWVEYLHPTVKPLDLMSTLVQVYCPADGVVLDPFAGTGSTGVAAVAEQRNVVLIERDPIHVVMVRSRVNAPVQVSLFGEW